MKAPEFEQRDVKNALVCLWTLREIGELHHDYPDVMNEKTAIALSNPVIEEFCEFAESNGFSASLQELGLTEGKFGHLKDYMALATFAGVLSLNLNELDAEMLSDTPFVESFFSNIELKCKDPCGTRLTELKSFMQERCVRPSKSLLRAGRCIFVLSRYWYLLKELVAGIRNSLCILNPNPFTFDLIQLRRRTEVLFAALDSSPFVEVRDDVFFMITLLESTDPDEFSNEAGETSERMQKVESAIATARSDGYWTPMLTRAEHHYVRSASLRISKYNHEQNKAKEKFFEESETNEKHPLERRDPASLEDKDAPESKTGNDACTSGDEPIQDERKLTKDEFEVLRICNESQMTLLIDEIHANRASDSDSKQTKEIVKKLVEDGILHRPNGKRKGATSTQKGKAYLNS